MASNNELNFTFDFNGWTLEGGTFTVTDFSVSSGQNNDLEKGQVKKFSSDGSFAFAVDRHGTSEVASWFSDKIANDQNTFNHAPGDLNFAILGDLTFTISSYDIPDGQDTYTFNNVMLAQGHSFQSNNWWFGGESATWQGDNTVSCTGQGASSGTEATIYFYRAENIQNKTDVNEIKIVQVSISSTD
ncbi:hypothetical protein [Flavobacterium subsaxonicum]|uniref:Uncharacterized protein n=1 Tax=Flavobacterium subsaxonicum WB 4.1-42 = DSM 21790 TaxID=1121898 RepID=A0A0A2MI87_9FLAO|nr:hypothetical protein [Flavobacterium subsaxonicum]KGO92357.1 hypothetical protein Q766_12905 [Flavobacterium subsaxonicum WB 4.1-42 = DSM 21790]